MDKTILLIANGESISSEKALALSANADLIIAIDGGTEFCLQIGIDPDYIVGDMDSVPARILKEFPDSKIVPLPDQNMNDLQKTLDFCVTFHPEKINLINVSGLRTDHFIANLIIFDACSFSEKLTVYDNSGILNILSPGHHSINADPGKIVSFLSFKPVSGLTLEGFEFPLHDTDFSEELIGISNRVVSNNASLFFKTGKIFCFSLNE